jgi:death on curing protein
MRDEADGLTLAEVRAIHGEIMAESGGAAGILSEGDLASALAKPKNLYAYNPEASLYDWAAAYGYGLVKNHCFVDGNKRIGLIAVYVFLDVNGVELVAGEAAAAAFFLELAASRESQEVVVAGMARWLRENCELREG